MLVSDSVCRVTSGRGRATRGGGASRPVHAALRPQGQIRQLARDPQVVPALVHHLRTAKTPNVCQLAAVLLRKKITSHWPKLPLDSKASLKQALIDSSTLDHRSFTNHLSPNPFLFLSVCLS